MTFLFAVLAVASAQDVSPQVEVASIKPSRPDATARNATAGFSQGRFDAMNVTLADVLNGLRGYDGRVRGGPKWVQTDRYDIAAKLDPVLTRDQRSSAILALLRDRFKLEIHHEDVTEPALALTAGKAASHLTVAKDDEPSKVQDGLDRVVFQAAPISPFVNYLRQILKVTILDQTDLKGRYDFTLELDKAAEQLEASGLPTAAASSVGRPSFPDRVRFAAEALGFRFVPAKATLDMTVVDHAERPSEN